MTDSIARVLAAGGARHANIGLYGYIPTEWICILFIVLFALSTLLHLGQAIHSRLWWLACTAVLAGIAEVIGWSGRLWSNKNIGNLNPFLMQIVTTILGPTPLIAASFVILGQVIRRLGQQYSRLNATWYTIVFCSCDLIALIIQAVGGANASIALQNGNNPNPGSHIMLAGIAFQLAALCIYLLLAVEFLLRYFHDKPFRRGTDESAKKGDLTPKIRLMIIGLGLEGLFLMIRSIYRTIELQDGWGGRIIRTQVYFNVLDGAMIVLAMYTLNLFHPSYLLGKAHTWMNSKSNPSDTDAEKVQDDRSSTSTST